MNENQEVYRDVLNAGYTLHWYEVKSVLGRGSFGVTYLAQDKNLDQLVAIKEYFPRDFSSRASGSTVHPTTGEKKELYDWGLVRFVREAQTLAKFKHHNIVRVMSVFELNNTAYMVMEYEQGEELSKLYKRKKNFTEQELLAIFLPIMHGLKLVHDAGFIHRDIKPSNIFIRADGSPVLIDFGAARKTIGAPTRTVTSLVTYGYAPFEQYNESEEKQTACTDIYALGACLYLAVVGKLPIDALARGSSLLSKGIDPYEPASVLKKDNYSEGFLRAIDHALMFHASDRPQDILLWADMLSGRFEVPPLGEPFVMPPNGLNEEDETVVMTTPPGVSDRRGTNTHPATLPLTTPLPASGSVATTSTGQESVRANRRWSAIEKGALVIILTLVVVSTIWVIWKSGGSTTSNQSEHKTITKTLPELSSLFKAADAAYKAGKLLDKEGGAIYQYQQILKIDPSSSEAKNRVKVIIELSSDGIRSDLAEGFFDRAQTNYRLLLDAAPKSSEVVALRDEMQSAEDKQNTVSNLLKQADSEFKAGRLTSPKNQNALLLYRRILKLSPNNQDAKRGIDTIVAHFVALAEANLAHGKTDQVKRNLEDILAVDPASDAVEPLRRKLRGLNASNQQQQEIEQLLSQARRALKAGDLINPANRNALALYRRVLKLDRNNLTAKQGILNVENELKAEYDMHMKSSEFTSAESVLREIEAVMPDSSFARNLRADWERRKTVSRSDVEIITDMIGKFKHSFEARDMDSLRALSEYQINRQSFLQQFFSNYTSFKIVISDIKFTNSERKGTALISIVDLVNIQGSTVKAGAWGHFPVDIRRNSKGQWKVFW